MTPRIETEALQALRKAASEATGDPARYPRRGIIDQYHGTVVAAYERGELVQAAEVLENRTVIDHLGDLVAHYAAQAEHWRSVALDGLTQNTGLKRDLAAARAEITRLRLQVEDCVHEC